MSLPPRIWLDYRPVRIGWVIDGRDTAQLETAARWNACLWGGRYNPIIAMEDITLANQQTRLFGVDVLVPVIATTTTESFIKSHPHLHFHMWTESIFNDRQCEFLDIRHAAKKAARHAVSEKLSVLRQVVQPTWTSTDPLAPFLHILLGRYPDPAEIEIDYPAGLRSDLGFEDKTIIEGEALSPDWLSVITPLGFSGFDLSWRRERASWAGPGVVFGNATQFDDLVRFWNLRAAGAEVCFYDPSQALRLKIFVEAFLDSQRRTATDECRVNIWLADEEGGAGEWTTDLNVKDLRLGLRPKTHEHTSWNGLNIRPVKPQFTMWHHDVVSSFVEQDQGATASFALPDRPFDDDPQALNQNFVVSIDANQHGSAADDLTFTTPFIPELNEFYGRNFHFQYDRARAEPGSLGHGAIGIITSLSTQRLSIHALHVHQWLHAFFQLVDVTVRRSEPGLRCARLIRQLGGLRASHVLKVRGARELLREYGPDQSFTRSAAEKIIGDFDESTRKMQFSAFENLYIQQRERGKLTPGDVFQYMIGRGIFRVGLDFKCVNCELNSWIPIDDIRTVSTCIYCGHQFDVTSQLKDRDWRYRRSGLFGRDDNQLGSIPVTLALQQLETTLHDSLLMCTTALEFESRSPNIEKCESDFLAVVAGAAGRNETPVQLLFGEAKTGKEFDSDDVRKLSKLADAVQPNASAFVMFAKTEAFTENEIRLAHTLNSDHHRRVILWSRDELEPYHVYERAGEKLGQRQYAGTLTDMARITHELWFTEPGADRLLILHQAWRLVCRLLRR